MKIDIIKDLFSIILERKKTSTEGSYTCYLFEKGIDKILKKCGEECAELIIAAKNNDKTEIVMESADLIYHMLVLLADLDIDIEKVLEELEVRANKQKNLKVMKVVDKDS